MVRGNLGQELHQHIKGYSCGEGKRRVLIGGIDSDPSPAQIDGTAARKEGNSGLYRFADDLRRDEVIPEYFNWNGTRAGKIKSENPPGARGIADFMRVLGCYPKGA